MPAILSTRSIVDFYEVDSSNRKVTLTVKIGYRQNALSTVRINEKQVNSDFVRSFKIDLGTNQELIDKELKMTTVVHDISEDTNTTSVKVILTGGVGDFEDLMKKTVSSHGDMVTYTVNIGFFKV